MTHDRRLGTILSQHEGEQRSSASAWSEVYRVGDHSLWDHASPSTELIGYILGARLRLGSLPALGCSTWDAERARMQYFLRSITKL